MLLHSEKSEIGNWKPGSRRVSRRVIFDSLRFSCSQFTERLHWFPRDSLYGEKGWRDLVRTSGKSCLGKNKRHFGVELNR